MFKKCSEFPKHFSIFYIGPVLSNNVITAGQTYLSHMLVPMASGTRGSCCPCRALVDGLHELLRSELAP